MNFDEDELNNFDDEFNAFDDETALNYSGKSAKQAPRKASFDLVLKNLTAAQIKFELFNAISSFTTRQRLDLVLQQAVSLIPLTSLDGVLAAGAGVVGYNLKGDLVATGAGAAVALQVSCAQKSYRSLVEWSISHPFTIDAVRMTVQTPGQIDNQIVHFKETVLGGSTQNTITPRTSFRPDQFQSSIIDIPMNFGIDGEKGLVYTLNANETVTWNVIITR